VISQNERYLVEARQLCELSLKIFNNPQSVFLYYTDDASSALIARTTEISDNVIPSSNSQMALNLFYLGHYFDKAEWINRAEKMLNAVAGDLKEYGAGYSNWACLGLHLSYPFREIAIVGNNVNEKLLGLAKQGLTNTILAVSAQASGLPLVDQRFVDGQTLIYVCENKACKLPVSTVEEALQQFA
jgi:hypothetical protein